MASTRDRRGKRKTEDDSPNVSNNKKSKDVSTRFHSNPLEREETGSSDDEANNQENKKDNHHVADKLSLSLKRLTIGKRNADDQPDLSLESLTLDETKSAKASSKVVERIAIISPKETQQHSNSSHTSGLSIFTSPPATSSKSTTSSVSSITRTARDSKKSSRRHIRPLVKKQPSCEDASEYFGYDFFGFTDLSNQLGQDNEPRPNNGRNNSSFSSS